MSYRRKWYRCSFYVKKKKRIYIYFLSYKFLKVCYLVGILFLDIVNVIVLWYDFFYKVKIY